MSRGASATNTRTVGGKLSGCSALSTRRSVAVGQWSSNSKRASALEHVATSGRRFSAGARRKSAPPERAPRATVSARAAAARRSSPGARGSRSRREASAGRCHAPAALPRARPDRFASRRHRSASASSSIFRALATGNLRVAPELARRVPENHPGVADGAPRIDRATS